MVASRAIHIHDGDCGVSAAPIHSFADRNRAPPITRSGSWTRAFGVLVALALLCLLSIALAADSPARVHAEDDSQVETTVRGNPLRLRLFPLIRTAHSCRSIPVLVEITNLGNERIRLVEERLLFDNTGLRVLGHLRLYLPVLSGHQRRFSIWLMQPLRAGEFVIMASANAMFSGELITTESAGELVRVRSGCSRWRAK